VSQEFKDLIAKVACGEIIPPAFSEDDLDKVKSCLPPPTQLVPEQGPAEPSFKESCLPSALNEAQKIIEEEQKNVKLALQVSKVKGKVEEYLANLEIIQVYFTERLNFILSVSQATNPLNAQKMSIQAKLDRELRTLLPVPSTVFELTKQITDLKRALTQVVTTKLENISEISDSPAGRNQFRTALDSEFRKISRKISPTFSDKIIKFRVSLHELIFGEIVDGETKFNIPIQSSLFISNKQSLNSVSSFVTLTNVNKSINTTNESSGLLYDGLGQYDGLYKRLRTPIQSLFTLDERGLTTNINEIDSNLRDNPDAPKTIQEDDLTFFIKSLSTYESFYDTLGPQLAERLETERQVTYPLAISPVLTSIKALARMEAALQIRTYNLEENLSESTVFNGITWAPTNPGLANSILLYKNSVDRVNSQITEARLEIEKLDVIVRQYLVDPDKIAARIASIPCFKTSEISSECEAETAKKKGIDPFGLKTLNGTDAGLPDPTTLCYWKYFAEELTALSILPVPDIKSPLFRYYPINGIIPAFPPVIISLPQYWKTLSVISSPIGTIVAMISLPITAKFASPIPIPIPSIFFFYIAPDANKYMILAPNLPFLSQPDQINIGYEFDFSTASQNPTGLSSPYSGLPVKGAFSIPLKISANSAKSIRLAKIAIDVAQGKPIQVNLPNGKPAPGDLGELSLFAAQNLLKSEQELALDSAETTPLQDFDRIVSNIRTSITTQLDSLGNIATASIQKIKDDTRSAKDRALESAKLEPGSERRRKLKTAARSIDPASIEDKISAMISEANGIIDSLTLGELTYPDDPSKLNPKLSSAITSIIDLLQLGSQGKLKNNRDSDLVKKMKRILKKLDVREYLVKDSYDLENDQDINSLKTGLKNLSKGCVDYLKGVPQKTDTSEARTTKEIEEVSNNDKEFQDLLVKSLSFTAAALAVPPKISVFDPTKPCCETESESIFKGVPPEVIAVLSIFSALSAALIDGLDKDSIKTLFGGVRQAGAREVKAAFDSILSLIPPITLPAGANPVALISSLIVPILSAISLPGAPDPARPILPIQIKIPLDALIKPVLKLALAALIQAIFRLLANLLTSKNSSGANSEIDVNKVISELDCGSFGIVKLSSIKNNQIGITLPNGKLIKLPLFPDIPLDLIKYFSLLSSTDIVSFLKKLILSSLDSILGPIEAIVRPILSLVPSGSWESLSILDVANPLTSIIKLIKKKLKDLIGKGLKINLINFDIYPALLAVALPILENLQLVLKEIAYLGTIILCSTGSAGVRLARLAHPIFNQDDLPPWERLTRKNPLFAIFLDEILYKSTIMSLGTLIFQTKLPGVPFVTTPITPILSPFPRG